MLAIAFGTRKFPVVTRSDIVQEALKKRRLRNNIGLINQSFINIPNFLKTILTPFIGSGYNLEISEILSGEKPGDKGPLFQKIW